VAKILVVDDDNLSSGLICLYLVKHNHDVTTANNGREALRCLEAEPFDILITDIIMPEMDGYGLLMHLMLKPNRPRIIAISAGTGSIEANHVLELTASLQVDKVIIKPVQPDILNEIVNKLLHQ